MKALNITLALVAGAAIGLVAGVLIAPEKGEILRQRIAEELRKQSQTLRERGETLCKRVEEALRKRGIRLSNAQVSELVEEIAEEFGNHPAADAEAPAEA